MLDYLAEGRRERHPHENTRPLSSAGFDLKSGADERGALLHANQPEASALVRVFGLRKSDPIVLDDEQDAIGSPLEDHLNVFRPRVLGRVVQRFLCDPV
jgi:hypothetical protein